MEANYIAVVLVLFCGLDIAFGEICYTGGYSSSIWSETKYCSNGCCGSGYDQYCCPNIGAIAGGVIGGIILLSIIIAVICVCQKKQRPGHVVQPVGGATVIMSHQQGYAMAPQPYPPAHPAPAYGGNPAYPPPYPGNIVINNAPPPPGQY